jgi:putative molybdopterin biosynthesis protein
MAAALPRGAGVLTSLVRADGLLWVPAGSRGNDAGAEVEISLLRDPAEIEGTIVAMGSNDLALDLAASALRGADVGRSLATWSPGFRAGLSGLREGLCHLAGVAHLGPLTGQSQLDEISDAVEGLKLAAVRLAVRQQGLMVAPANPLAIGGIADLARDDVRYVNRQLGSVTRALLERELERLGIAQSSVTGYKREEGTHLAVAAAVASGRCDCGLGLLAAARAFGLGFIPLWTECYDLVLDANMVETELLAPLWHLLSSPAFQAAVRALGGYDTSETGMRMF